MDGLGWRHAFQDSQTSWVDGMCLRHTVGTFSKDEFGVWRGGCVLDDFC